MPNSIAIYNFKGGVGKTSTTLNLAYSWSQLFKVLVIDCDPQCNATQALLNSKNLNEETTIFKLSKQLLHNETPDIAPIEIHPYLHIIPGDFKMLEMEENSQFISFAPMIFYKLMARIKHQYDFIILDFPTNFGTIVKSFISNIDNILIPSIPESFSLTGFKKLLGYLTEIKRNKPLNILGIFFNQYKRNTLLHRKVVQEMEDELGEIVFNQKIRESIKVGEANHNNKSIFSIMEDNGVARDFIKLSDEIIEKLNSKDLDQVVYDIYKKKSSQINRFSNP